MGNITLKKILTIALLLEIYNSSLYLSIKIESYMYGSLLLSFLLISSTMLYLYRESKISTYYLAIAYFINLIQITNELSLIYGGSQYEILGAKSFAFYIAELLISVILYASVLLFINKNRTKTAQIS